MGFLIGLLLVPLITSGTETVVNLRAITLKRQLLRGEPTPALVRRAREEMNGGPVYHDAEPRADSDLALHDTTLMELAYLEPGTVSPEDLGCREFGPLIMVHERVRRDVETLRDPGLALDAPRLGERVWGRPAFARTGSVALRIARDLPLIKAYWSEMNRRASDRLGDHPMTSEFERVADVLRHRVNQMIESATRGERLLPRFRFRRLRRLADELNQDELLRHCQDNLTPFLEEGKRLDQLRRRSRPPDVEARRRAIHLVRDHEKL